MNFSQALEAMKAGSVVSCKKYQKKKNRFFIKENQIYGYVFGEYVKPLPLGMYWFLGSDYILSDDWEVVE